MWLPVGNGVHLSTDFEGNDIINLFPVLWFSVLEIGSLDKVQAVLQCAVLFPRPSRGCHYRHAPLCQLARHILSYSNLLLLECSHRRKKKTLSHQTYTVTITSFHLQGLWVTPEIPSFEGPRKLLDQNTVNY